MEKSLESGNVSTESTRNQSRPSVPSSNSVPASSIPGMAPTHPFSTSTPPSGTVPPMPQPNMPPTPQPNLPPTPQQNLPPAPQQNMPPTPQQNMPPTLQHNTMPPTPQQPVVTNQQPQMVQIFLSCKLDPN